MNTDFHPQHSVSPESVEGLFFCDYQHSEQGWVQNPLMTATRVAMYCQQLDWSRVSDFRIHDYPSLVRPVDELGRDEVECGLCDVPFEPVRQRVEFLFGEEFRITPETLAIQLESTLSDDYEHGVFLGRETDTILLLSHQVGHPFRLCGLASSEEPSGWQLVDASLIRDQLIQTQRVLERFLLPQEIDMNLFVSSLLEHSINDVVTRTEPETHPVIEEVLEISRGIYLAA